ncbi:MAG: LacI family DNA-binding transcriptional regulator [Clostridia bacterium]|nr:LacI family DNA-binding transcriptional regulator [Clostridia bacterium]
MPPTINDVAKRAGVSRSTVSLVLNHSPLVKEETRRLVEQVIHEINYVPNSNARGLSARVTSNLGVILMKDYLPESTQVSYDSDQHIGLCSYNIFNGIMAGLTGTDYGLITEAFCLNADAPLLPRLVTEKRVDGLFVVGRP